MGAGHKMTMGRVFAHLHHGGDESTAAKDLRAAAIGSPAASKHARALPAHVLEAIAVERKDPAFTAFDEGVCPVPLARRSQLPQFPVAALPDSVAAMVAAVSEFTQTDPGMAASVALGMLAASLGGHVQVEARTGWREPVNLYTAVVAAPGERKSAVLDTMTEPVVDAERRLGEDIHAIRVEAETTKDIARRAAEKSKADAGKAEPAKRKELAARAIAEAEIADSIDVPVIPRILADDITPEACVSLLAEQRGRVAVVSAEGGIFDIIAGRYSNNQPVLDVWLKGHSGDILRVDRKGRDPEYIRHPALTLVLMLQPAVLTAIAGKEGFRGRGLLARFLFAMPPTRVGNRRVDPAPVLDDVKIAYTKTIDTLVHEFATWEDPIVLRLTPAAHEEVLGFAQLVEVELGSHGRLAHIADWGSKLVGATLRIAGLLHIAQAPSSGWRNPIEESCMAKAIEIAHYYESHALAAFDAMHADPLVGDAEYLLEVIRRLGGEMVTQRELLTAASRSRFKRSKELLPPLALLEEHGYIAAHHEEPSSGPGRPASKKWRVHPTLRATQ